jgi:hypothetical protein
MPLLPPGTYRKTRGIIRRGLIGAIPAADTVLEGTIYYSTDTRRTFRSNATSWDSFDDAQLAQVDDSTGTQNSWNPGVFGLITEDIVIFWEGASDITVNGMNFNGNNGQRVTIVNIGSNVAYFAHQSGSATASKRFMNVCTIITTPVAPRGSVTYQHDGEFWYMISHEQAQDISYSTAWTGTITNPAIGNGSLTALYRVVGGIIKGTLSLSIGSTTTLGTGAWIFTYPATINLAYQGVGFALLAGTYYLAQSLALNSTQFVGVTPSTNAAWSATTPGAWANGDTAIIHWEIR